MIVLKYFLFIKAILKDLSQIRYICERSTIFAYCLGLPHEKERVFIIPYPQESTCAENGEQRRKLEWDLCGFVRFGKQGAMTVAGIAIAKSFYQ
ncbi:hypothetical protein [Nostoc sp.]|uniref:hypothetical protein n=1 Tax=Nostoc sp. TaxID=1180 RepID=UPI002FF4AF6C